MTFNFFAIFGTSSKYERAFNKAGYTILACQNNLNQAIIERREVFYL